MGGWLCFVVFGDSSIKVIRIGMEPIIAEFILNPKKDQNAAGQPHGESNDIDRGIPLIPFNIPPCDF
jgi:hypothetical protein